MFTQADLSTLMSAAPPLAVSIFLPTHIKGSQIRQDPIRLQNLTGQARELLLAAGLSSADADTFLAPALTLVDDHFFWQHQDLGLALFLDGEQTHIHTVPVPVTEKVIVGTGFHVRPLLTLLAADGEFAVLTITAQRTRFFQASRFAMTEDTTAGLPANISEGRGEPDYQNPVQASPVARPHTGSVDISNAQVYGDSPEDWRQHQLVDFTRRVAAAVDAHTTVRPVPLVLVADAETSGHFQKFTTHSQLLTGVIEANPETMTDTELHAAAYRLVQHDLDADRRHTLEQFQELRGTGNTRAATGIEDVLRAAHHGQVDTLLLVDGKSLAGHYDPATDQVITDLETTVSGPDLLDDAALQTLLNGGRIHLLTGDTSDEMVSAILRY